MNHYYNGYATSTLNSINNLAIWMIVSFVLAIIGGIVLYFTFLSKKNENKFTGFLGWLYDFLQFKKMFAESLLRIGYLVISIFITLYSFSLISRNFFTFVIYLIVGNIIVRVIYEFALIALMICRNTSEINKKLTKKEENNNSNKE